MDRSRQIEDRNEVCGFDPHLYQALHPTQSEGIMADVASIKEAITAYVAFFNEEGKILRYSTYEGRISIDNAYWGDPLWVASDMGLIHTNAGFRSSLKHTLAIIREKFPKHEIEARPIFLGWGDKIEL